MGEVHGFSRIRGRIFADTDFCFGGLFFLWLGLVCFGTWNSRLTFSFWIRFLNGRSFWNQPSSSGEPAIADANFFISLEIMFASSRIVMGIFIDELGLVIFL